MDPPPYPQDRKGPIPSKKEEPSDEPPPSYRESTNPAATASSLLPSEPGNVQRFPNQEPHLLHIYRDAIMSQNLTIMAPDKRTIVYTVAANIGSLFSEKPHMRVYRGPVETQALSQPVGTVTFRPYSRTVEMTLHGRETLLEGTGILGRSHSFMSPGIGTMTWKTAVVLAQRQDATLENGRGEWIARYESKVSLDKRGILEIVSWEIGGASLDEVVVSGLAMSEWMRRRR